MRDGRYIVVGAYTTTVNPQNGMPEFSGLVKIGEFQSLGQAEKARTEHYDKCWGIIDIFTLGDEKSTEGTLKGSH